MSLMLVFFVSFVPDSKGLHVAMVAACFWRFDIGCRNTKFLAVPEPPWLHDLGISSALRRFGL